MYCHSCNQDVEPMIHRNHGNADAMDVCPNCRHRMVDYGCGCPPCCNPIACKGPDCDFEEGRCEFYPEDEYAYDSEHEFFYPITN